jgi:hypothetical protein
MQMTVRQSEINLFDFARMKLSGERLVSPVSARNHHDTTRFTVEPVNDAGAEIVAAPGKRAEVMQQRIDESAVRVARACVDHHAGGLVNHYYVVIEIEDFEWEFFGLGMEGREVGGRDRDGVAGPQEMRGAGGSGVHAHPVFLNP